MMNHYEWTDPATGLLYQIDVEGSDQICSAGGIARAWGSARSREILRLAARVRELEAERAAGVKKTSLAVLTSGLTEERARIRRELLESCPPAAWVADWLNDTLDRICPEEG